MFRKEARQMPNSKKLRILFPIRPGYEIKNFQRDGWIVGKGACDGLLSVLRNTCEKTDSRGLLGTFEIWLREFLDKQFKALLNEQIVGKTVVQLRKLVG